MARESTVVFKGIKPFPERYPEAQKEVAAEIHELMAAAEPRVRNLFQQNQGIRLRYRDDVNTFMPGDAWDVFFVDGEAWNENCHFTVSLYQRALEIGLTIPNHAKNRQWERFNTLARDKDKFVQILKSLRADVPELWVRMWHRHDMGGQKLVQDGEACFKIDTIYGFEADQTENRYFKPASSWYVLLKELVSERLNHRFNLEVQFYVPYFIEADDPRRQYRDKIAPYLATPDTPGFIDEVVRAVQVFGPFFIYLLG